MHVDRRQVLRFRARATHLDERLPHARLAQAAYAGLQDSAPRAGVISLHARATDVGPDAWEDPSLAQIWFRGGADYIVPRDDIGVFTLGSLPRDESKHLPLERIADAAHEVLQGRTLKVREVSDALEMEQPFALRLAAMTGRLLIRWDASMIWLIPSERPEIDPEDARRELARRFLRWFAPVTVLQLAKWAGVEPAEAKQTRDAISDEVIPVEVDGESRFVLRDDADALARPEPIEGVRLIPHSDPLIKIDGELVVPDAEPRREIFPVPKLRASFWPVAGALLVNGEICGSWARQQRRVTVHPWRHLELAVRDEIEREALGFPIASRSEAEVIWA